MATFILLASEDAESASGALAYGSRALESFTQAVEKLGARNVEAWATAGRFDIVCVADFPDMSSVLAVSMLEGTLGRHVEPLPAGRGEDLNAARALLAPLIAHNAEASSAVAKEDGAK